MKDIVGVRCVIGVPASHAWEVISGLGGLDEWLPAVRSCRIEGSGVGARRYCMLANGAGVTERIDEVDHKQMRVRYSITESPLPLQGYIGTITVTPVESSRAEVAWYAEYTPASEHAVELREMLRGAIAEGIRGLETYCQKDPAHNRPLDADQRIRIAPTPHRIRVVFKGRVVADTRRALTLREVGHAPVHYIPREDVSMEMLERSAHVSHCPHKGDAAYFRIREGDCTAENAVWTYEEPHPTVAEIKDRLAFYPHMVDAIEETHNDQGE